MSKKDMIAMVIALGCCLPFGTGCVAAVEPGVYVAPPVVEVDPFPFVWVGPGYYGGRYYGVHPGHGGFRGGPRGGFRGHRR